MLVLGLLYICALIGGATIGVLEASDWVPYSITAARVGLVVGAVVGVVLARMLHVLGRPREGW